MATKKKKKRKKRAYHRGQHESAKLIGEANYRSGWELKYMQWLDEDVDVVSYEYEPFTIEYISNKKTKRIRKYIPDLLVTRVSGSQELIEIKPTNKLQKRLIQKKHSVARDWCESRGDIEFKVVTEIELKALGVL